MKIVPNGWQEFQHYKKRSPPWIKLHHKILDNFDFQRLQVASKALAPMLWLIASEHKDGVIDADFEVLAFRLRWTPAEIEEALSPLIGKGFFSVVQFDSKPLAPREQLAMPETETETEKTSHSGPNGPSPSGPVWGEGLSLLTSAGIQEPNARRFIGMVLGEYEEGVVLAALNASIGKADPLAYCRGVLKSKPKKVKPPKGSEAVLASLRQQHGDAVVPSRDGKSFYHPSGMRWKLDGERMATA